MSSGKYKDKDRKTKDWTKITNQAEALMHYALCIVINKKMKIII